MPGMQLASRQGLCTLRRWRENVVFVKLRFPLAKNALTIIIVTIDKVINYRALCIIGRIRSTNRQVRMTLLTSNDRSALA